MLAIDKIETKRSPALNKMAEAAEKTGVGDDGESNVATDDSPLPIDDEEIDLPTAWPDHATLAEHVATPLKVCGKRG
jgi:hypothetical protein